MARQFLRNAVRALSIEEQAKGSILDGDDGAEFRAYASEESPRTKPGRDLVPDTMVGGGSPYAQKSKVINWNPIDVPWTGVLNTTTAVKLLRALMGGTATETADAINGTSSWEILMKLPGENPYFLNYLENLAVGMLYADVFIQTWEATQEMKQEPRFTSRMGNTGHFVDIDDTSLDVADVEDVESYLRFDPNKTRITWSDGLGSYDYAGESRLISAGATLNQNVAVENLPGDPYIDEDNECHGSYGGTATIGLQSAQMRAKVYDEGSFDDFNAFAANRTITNLTLTFETCEFIGDTDVHHFKIAIKFPSAEMNYTEDSQDGKSAYNLEFNAIKGDPTKNNSLVVVTIVQVDEANIEETIA